MDWTAFSLFACVTAVILYYGYRHHMERMELINRGIHDFVKVPARKGGKSLLFGLFIAGIGLALLIHALVYNFDKHIFAASLYCLFGGGALVLYWKVTATDREQACRWYEQSMTRKSDDTQQVAC